MNKLDAFGEGKSKNGSTKRTGSTTKKDAKKASNREKKKAGNSVQLPGKTDVYDDLAAIEEAVSPDVVERYRKGNPTVREAAKAAGIPATMQEAEELWETLDISNALEERERLGMEQGIEKREIVFHCPSYIKSR